MYTDFSHIIKNIIIAVLFLFLIWRGCEPITPDPIGNIIKTETYTDTNYVTHVDTTMFYDTVTVTKTLLSYTYVERIKKDSSKLYTFKTHVNDSLISGDITTRVKVKDSIADMVSQNIEYKTKFPKFIHQTDSIFIHDSTVVTVLDSRPALFIGSDISLGNQNNQGSIIPKIGIDLGNTIIEGGYDIFNKQFVIGGKYKLRRKKYKK